MSRKLAGVTALVAVVALAFVASATSSATPRTAQPATATAGTTTQIGAASVRLTVKKFVRRGHKYYAVGTAYGTFAPTAANPQNLPTKTVKRAFTARVLRVKRVSSAQRICPVLDLTLAPLDLNLLGLMVHLDQVHLTITANSNGGVLGSLLCGLANNRFSPQAIVLNWTQAATQSGLATKGVTMSVPLYVNTSSTGTKTLSIASTKSPLAICQVLNLTLGPLDLNLLGLMVHLDTVHLTITADSNGGILGSLLCSLAGGGSPSP
jgi:Na+/H+ antiporter NhaB